MSSLDEVPELTPEQIAALVQGVTVDPPPPVRDPRGSDEGAGGLSTATPPHRYFQPLSQATDDFVFQARTVDSRVYTGIDTFDNAMRGLGPKQLMLVQGYTHSGKTVFTTNMLRFNKGRRIALFTPDEDRVSILIKLVSIEHGVSAQELEYRITQGDDDAVALIRNTAEEHYPQLAVFEDIDDLDTMTKAMDEVQDHWGAAPELVVFDFVDLLTNGDQFAEGATAQKVKAIKAWGRRQAPTLALHQTSRTAGADGAEQTISSGSYGGESAATFLIGVRRKRDYWGAMVRELEEKKRRSPKWGRAEDDLLKNARYEKNLHQDTITLNLVKNKRPPGPLVPEVDFKLDPETGKITPFERGETSTLGTATRAWLEQQREMF